LELSSFKMGYSSIICMIMGFKCLYHRQGSFDIVYGVCRLICGPNAAIVIKKADLVITDVEHIDTTSDDGSYFLKDRGVMSQVLIYFDQAKKTTEPKFLNHMWKDTRSPSSDIRHSDDADRRRTTSHGCLSYECTVRDRPVSSALPTIQ
jgi:hypothetical protein